MKFNILSLLLLIATGLSCQQTLSGFHCKAPIPNKGSSTVTTGCQLEPDKLTTSAPVLVNNGLFTINSAPSPNNIFSSMTNDGLRTTVLSSTDGFVALMTDEEYKHLQELREAVTKEEHRLALHYGASFYPNVCSSNMACYAMYFPPNDIITFHGRFIIIDRPHYPSPIN